MVYLIFGVCLCMCVDFLCTQRCNRMEWIQEMNVGSWYQINRSTSMKISSYFCISTLTNVLFRRKSPVSKAFTADGNSEAPQTIDKFDMFIKLCALCLSTLEERTIVTSWKLIIFRNLSFTTVSVNFYTGNFSDLSAWALLTRSNVSRWIWASRVVNSRAWPIHSVCGLDFQRLL